MRIKKLLSVVLTVALLTVGVTGCSNSKKEESSDKTTVKLGVVGAIYEDLWKPAIEKLKEEDINLEIVQFSDYSTPNSALNSGEIDLNAFQHQIFLDSDVSSNGYGIEAIAYSFIIPLNLYSNKVTSVKDIKDGDIVAIPNDVTNGGRALKVLESAGLITLKSNEETSPTVNDIEKYNVKIEIKELAANTIPSVLPDITAGIVNGGFALDYGLKVEDAIYKDTSINESVYWNIIAAKSDNLKDDAKLQIYKKVISAFQTEETEKVFNDTFGGYFVKAGWDKELLNK